MTGRARSIGLGLFAAIVAALALLAAAGSAAAAETEIRFTADDGVSLQTTLYGDAGKARPTVVEFSPYGNGSRSATASRAGAPA